MRMLIIIASLVLVGCAGAVPWNKQNYAGITSWDFKYCKVESEGREGAEYTAVETQQICHVTVDDGKERGSVQLDFVLPDGTIMNYLANDEAAFDGQRVRAEVEIAVTEAVSKALDDLIRAGAAIISPVPIPEPDPDG